MDKLSKEKLISVIDSIVETAKKQLNDYGHPIFPNDRRPNMESITPARLDEICNLTLSVLTKVYGENSYIVKNFQTQLSDYYNPRISNDSGFIIELCVGKVNFLKNEIELDLLTTFEKEISSVVYGDFLKMAREAFDNNAKETSAVLSCAALEDALKKLAKINKLDTEEKGMTEIANSLKTLGFLKGNQGSLVTTYIKIRNKAFHAEWDKIDMPDIKSLIAFTEEFITTNF